MTPFVLDLCCGKGGWSAGFIAEGYRACGFDIDDQPEYPGTFCRVDVRLLAHQMEQSEALRGIYEDAALIVASPPCEEFTRHMLPWCKRKNPPPPDLSIWLACERIAAVLGIPIVLENVREAQRYFGRAKAHVGPFYLWGDVPAILPVVKVHRKERMSSTARLERARIPFELARHVARCFLPAEVPCP